MSDGVATLLACLIVGLSLAVTMLVGGSWEMCLLSSITVLMLKRDLMS